MFSSRPDIVIVFKVVVSLPDGASEHPPILLYLIVYILTTSVGGDVHVRVTCVLWTLKLPKLVGVEGVSAIE